jgi:hypothetical protein
VLPVQPPLSDFAGVLGASLIFAYVVRRSVCDLTAVRTDVYALCGDLRDDAHFVTNCNNALCSDLYAITNAESESSSLCPCMRKAI